MKVKNVLYAGLGIGNVVEKKLYDHYENLIKEGKEKDPQISSVLERFFENIDEVTAIQIQDDVDYMIRMHEPRVKLINVEAIPHYDNNQFDLVVVYQIIGADTPPQQLEFVLLPSR